MSVGGVGWVFTEWADLQQAVRDCTTLDETGVTCDPPIGSWDVSAVTSMQDMFYNEQKFNADISGMEHVVGDDHVRHVREVTSDSINPSGTGTCRVTTMQYMLAARKVRDNPIEDWDVISVYHGLNVPLQQPGHVQSADRELGRVGGHKHAKHVLEPGPLQQLHPGGWDVSSLQIMEQMFLSAKRSISRSDSGTSQRSPTCIVYSKAVPRSINPSGAGTSQT